MSFPTLSGDGVEGSLLREPQVCLGPAFGNSQYFFFVAGTSFVTAAPVYTDANLTVPFANANVQADQYGRFQPIYLDGSVTYGVQLFDGQNNLVYQIDPYVPTLSTRGLSTNVAYGPQIAVTGEVTVPAPAAGGTQLTLALKASVAGQSCIQISSALPGQSALVVNNSVTTGAQTATFTAANKPGTPPAGQLSLTLTAAPSGTYTGGNLTAPFTGTTGSYILGLSNGQGLPATFTNGLAAFTTTSTIILNTPSVPTTAVIVGVGVGPAGWLPVTCDGAQYYTPIWHGNSFTPYAPNPGAIGEVIVAGYVNFGGTGVTTATGGTATPGNWYSPATTNIGGGYYINITKTSGNTGTSFSAAQGSWVNITNGGLTIGALGSVSTVLTGTYQISPGSGGSPVVASGTIQLSTNPTGTGANDLVAFSGAASLILAGNGTATLNGVSTANWFLPTTGSIGASYWINITRTGGTSGVNFSAAQGAWTNITAGGLTIGLSGTSGQRTASGTYQISSNAGGTLVVSSGSISLTASGVNNTNYSGTAPLKYGGDGSATLNGVAQTNWFSPTTTNTGSGYWVNITRTSGTSGVNFAAAQGVWTNITNSGLSVALSGTAGNVGTVTAGGTYKISSASGGSPVLGSGTISLSLSGLTVIHVYTTAATSITETIPAGTTTVRMESFGSGGGGASGTGTGCSVARGTGGGAGGYGRSQYTAAALGGVGKTFKYTIGAAGAGGSGGGNGAAGSAGSIVAGTVTGFTTITANGGGGGNNASGSTGGTASGGNQANTTGASTTARSQTGAAGQSSVISGGGGPYGGGGQGGGFGSVNPGSIGAVGAAVFYYS